VANPGCHASATILALWPLARAGRIRGTAAVTSVTGSSGSGATPTAGTHHPERFTNFKAYKPLGHQHLPEILAALPRGVDVAFVPCSAPLARGIYATALVPVGDLDAAAVRAIYEDAYGAEPFVRIRSAPPQLRSVVGTNLVDLSTTAKDGTACVTVALDNLVKGMTGTAVQNMNLLLGIEETRGLLRPGCGL
jgi:N-acetyl-gamma-glutamyl-phosphate reductase